MTQTNPATLINQTSGDTEYYTPSFIIEAAREVMGGIDLDPASSAAANERVKATNYYTERDDGLTRQWHGRVWLNHPFTRVGNPLWIRKLITEFLAERCTAFCCITYACTSEAWFEPLHHSAQCYLIPRTNYYLPDGSLKRGVTKGSVVSYSGVDREKFARVFKKLGAVKFACVD